MNIHQSLTALGLEPRQADIYSYLLRQSRNKEQTAFKIARGLDIPRSTVYLTLSELENKRLVSSYKKNNILHYLVAEPTRLARDLEEKQDILNNLLPTLQALVKESAHSSSVQTFTGTKGVKIVYDDVFDNPHLKGIREYFTISHPKLMESMPKLFMQKMDYKRRMGLFSKVIVPELFKKNPPPEYSSNSHKEVRYLPGPAFEGTMIIYGTKVALFSHREDDVYSMIVDSPAIAEMLKYLMISLWNMLPPNPAK
jgi:sugar-specific transcriptional regulator TrmB